MSPPASSSSLDFNGVCRLFGFNLLAGVIFLVLFSLVKCLEYFSPLHSAREYLKRRDKSEKATSNPFAWIPALWRIEDKDVVDSAGLDASVYLRMFRLSIQLLGVYCAVGIVILIPTNLSAKRAKKAALDRFSIVNVDNKSDLLWVHFFCNIILSMFTICLLWMHYKHVWGQRHKFLASQTNKQRPEEFTLLVTDVPQPVVGSSNTKVDITLPGSELSVTVKRSTMLRIFRVLRRLSAGMVRTPSRLEPKDLAPEYTRIIDLFYTDLYPNSYLTHQAVCRFRKVKRKYQAWKDAAVQLNRAEWRQKKMMDKKYQRWVWNEEGVKEEIPRPKHKLGFLGLWGEEVDSIEYWEKKLPLLEAELEDEQEAAQKKRVSGSAFVSFKRRTVASVAAQAVHSEVGSTWTMQMAPAPTDVYWPNIELRQWERTLRQHGALLLVIAVILWFSVPVAFFTKLVNVRSVHKIFPFLRAEPNKRQGSQPLINRLAAEVLPSLGLRIVLWIVPPVFLALSYLEGSISHSEAERRTCTKHYYVLLFVVFVGSTFTTTLLDRFREIFNSPRSITTILADSIPRASSFFITYVFVSSLMFGIELIRFPIPLLRFLYLRMFVGKDTADREHLWDQGGIVYYVFMPNQNLIITMGVVFSVIAPIILPFVLLYSTMGYFVWKHQVMYVYSYPYQTGGLLWPHFVDNVWTAMVIGQLTMVGIFSLNLAYTQAACSLFLPFLTLYMRYAANKQFKRSFGCLPLRNASQVDRLMVEAGFKPTKKTFAGQYVPPYLRPFPRLSALDKDASLKEDGVRTDCIIQTFDPDHPPPPDDDDDDGSPDPGLGAPAGTPLEALEDWKTSGSSSSRTSKRGGVDSDWADSEGDGTSLQKQTSSDGSGLTKRSKRVEGSPSLDSPPPSPRKRVAAPKDLERGDAGGLETRAAGGACGDVLPKATWVRSKVLSGSEASPQVTDRVGGEDGGVSVSPQTASPPIERGVVYRVTPRGEQATAVSVLKETGGGDVEVSVSGEEGGESGVSRGAGKRVPGPSKSVHFEIDTVAGESGAGVVREEHSPRALTELGSGEEGTNARQIERVRLYSSPSSMERAER